MVKNKTKLEMIFDIANHTILIIFSLSIIAPFLHLIAKSVSEEAPVMGGKVTFYPIGFQLDTFAFALSNWRFMNSFKVSVIVTILGTLLALMISSLTAYPLSKPHLRGRRAILVFYIFLMIFNPGLVPSYMLVRGLGLMDSIWALTIPFLLNIFNMIVMKNFFEGIPESLDEAAKIDGASNIKILFRIVLPISTPVMATIGLFYAVAFWNDFFWARVYISSVAKQPLQLFLYELMRSADVMSEQARATGGEMYNKAEETVKAVCVILATIPILCLYPYLQKYFVTGLTIGSVKG